MLTVESCSYQAAVSAVTAVYDVTYPGGANKYMCVVVVGRAEPLTKNIRDSVQASLSIPIVVYADPTEFKLRHTSASTVRLILAVKADDMLSTVEELKTIAPQASIVVLSAADTPSVAKAALVCGAKGYIPVTREFEIEMAAIRFLLGGGTYFPSTGWGAGRISSSPNGNR